VRVDVPRAGTAVALGAVALGLGAYLWIPGVGRALDAGARALSSSDARASIEAFRAYLLGFGAWAPVASAAIMVLQAVIAPLPSFVVTFTNGLLFGWAWGALLSWSSAMAGAALCFGIARVLGRPAVERLLGGAAALDRADRFFVSHGRRAILLARLLPFVPFDAVSYGAGLTSTSFRGFLVATGAGQIPATLAYSYLGQTASGSMKVLLWVFSVAAALIVIVWAAPRVQLWLRPGDRAQGGGAP
jgi:uncharacterized membrane protein YdjX (TVP38/TMEM64 family)